jgi:hypothetical protein
VNIVDVLSIQECRRFKPVEITIEGDKCRKEEDGGNGPMDYNIIY